jgi:hypothetical protein
MSDRASTGFPSACSGDRYAAVPITKPVRVRVGSPVEVTARAMPKSMTFVSPDGMIMMFAGFTSLWTSPFSWALASASATSRAIFAARCDSRGPSASITSLSVWPSRYSMTIQWMPSSLPVSYTDTTLG